MYSSTIDVICLFCLCSQLHPIEEKNLKVIPEEEIIGKGVFGTCKKMSYQGHAVAVKYFNRKMTPDAVQKEARMLNTFDHDGMFVFHFVIFQTILLPTGEISAIQAGGELPSDHLKRHIDTSACTKAKFVYRKEAICN